MEHPISTEFLRKIPKTDLHLHIDGSLRLPTLIELARAGDVKLPSFDPEGLKAAVFKSSYASLREYLRGFQYTLAVLRTPENLERVAVELAEDCLAEGVRYIEVRFAPHLLIHDGLSARDAVRAVTAGLRRAQGAHNRTPAVKDGTDLPFEFGIIICAMRSFNARMGAFYQRLLQTLGHTPRKELAALASLETAREAVALRDEHDLPVVAFDLAGEEAGFPAVYHVNAYQYAHDHFLKKTVHAGEAYGPESIFQAITACHANRIGHGTFLFAADMIRDRSVRSPERYVESLAEYIASSRIGVEVSLTSNLQTCPSIRRIADHPVRRMLEHNLSVSICTDNRLVSDTSVTRELELLTRQLPLTPHQLRNVIVAGFKGSFFPGTYTAKRAYVRKATELYDALAARHG
jgi:adenosine deaminase